MTPMRGRWKVTLLSRSERVQTMAARDTRLTGDYRRIAALAAFAIAAMPVYLILPRIIGMTLGAQDVSGSNLDAQVAEILAHPNVYGSLGLLSLIVGPSLIVLALALHEHLRPTAPFVMRVAMVAGVIGGALFLLAGFGPMTTAKWLSEIDPQDHAAAIAMYVTNQSLTDRQVTTSSVLFGAFALIATLAGARAGLLPRALSYFGVLTGMVVVAVVLVPGLWIASALVMVVWSAWLGVALLMGGRHVVPASGEAIPGRA